MYATGRYGSAALVKERIISSSDTITGLLDKVNGGKKINCAYAASGQSGANGNVIKVDDPPREDLIPGETPDREDFELYTDG